MIYTIGFGARYRWKKIFCKDIFIQRCRKKRHMLRSASPFVIAAYAKVGLIPQASSALPLALFTASFVIDHLTVFYAVIPRL
jgi:hypothetical protein